MPPPPSHPLVALFVGPDLDDALANGVALEVQRFKTPQEVRATLEGRGGVDLVLMRLDVEAGLDAELVDELRRTAPRIEWLVVGDADLASEHVRALAADTPAEALPFALEAACARAAARRERRAFLDETLLPITRVLGEVLAIADPHAFRHLPAEQRLAGALARRLQCARPWELELAALLARLGTCSVPLEVLAKVEAEEPLSELERELHDAIPHLGATWLESACGLAGVRAELCPQHAPTKPGARALAQLRALHELEDHGLERPQALDELARTCALEDVELVEVLRELVSLADAPAREPRSRAELEEGALLAAPVLDKRGRRVMSEGQALGPVALARLRHLHTLQGLREPIWVEARRPRRRAS